MVSLLVRLNGIQFILIHYSLTCTYICLLLITSYKSCTHHSSNKHGLWAGPAVEVPTSEPVLEEMKSLAVSDECAASDFAKGAWPSVHADFLRLQAQVFESEMPFTEADGVKHTPYITVNEDGTSSILVGQVGVAIHPMNGSPDGAEGEPPHWITEIYVVDQDGKIVAMKSLDPTGVTEATMTFDTPEDATTLQAYSWCSEFCLVDGLF